MYSLPEAGIGRVDVLRAPVPNMMPWNSRRRCSLASDTASDHSDGGLAARSSGEFSKLLVFGFQIRPNIVTIDVAP